MKDKDVLFLCQFFYPEYITSAQLPFQTASKLVEDGLSVDVLCGYPKEYLNDDQTKILKKEIVNGLGITRVSYLTLSRGAKLSRLINYFSLVATLLFYIPKIRRYRTVIVYSNPPILPIIVILANMLFKTKIVFVCYDVYPEIALYSDAIPENGLIHKVMNSINTQLYKRATKIVALSNEMKDLLIRNREIQSECISVIPNWATETLSQTHPKISKTTKQIVLTYLGNMGIAQDLDTILSVINNEQIKALNVKFVFAGHGSKQEYIKQFIADKQLDNVEMHGYLQGEAFQKVLDDSDIFLVTLRNELNGLAVPSKFYTYLTTNKQIISIMNKNSDIAKEIEDLGLGYAIENHDTEAFVAIIMQLCEEKTSFNGYSEIYQKYYSKEVQLTKYSELMKEIVSGHQSKLS